MSKINGTVIAASRLEGGEQATCGIVVWTTVTQKAKMERWEYNGLVVVERKADHDAREMGIEKLCEEIGKLRTDLAAREAEVKRLREESKILRDGFTGYRETMRCEMGRLIAEVERLRDAECKRVAEGMSAWCSPVTRDAEVERLKADQGRLLAAISALQDTIARATLPLPVVCELSPRLVAINRELEHAKAKHPKFADVAVSSLDNKTAADGLADFRKFLNMVIGEGRSTGVDVLKCELWEAVEAFSRKDYAATMDELAQCGAVVIRMMEAVQALMDGQDKAGEEPIK